MSKYPAPPVGAHVRHTSNYADGTTVTVEGRVTEHSTRNQGILIGGKNMTWFAGLDDLPDQYTIHLEVLAEPTPPEPADGYYLDRDGDLWRRVDDGDPRRWHSDGDRCDWAAVNHKWGPLKRLIEDPASTAPELPCTIPTRWETRNLHVDTVDADGYLPIRITDTADPADRVVRLNATSALQLAAALLRYAQEPA